MYDNLMERCQEEFKDFEESIKKGLSQFKNIFVWTMSVNIGGENS